MKHTLKTSLVKTFLLSTAIIILASSGKVKAELAAPCHKQSISQSGYISVPGTNTAVKFGGFIQLDSFYDGGPDLGDVVNVENVPLKEVDLKASQSGNFGVSARASRLNFTSLSHTEHGDLKLFVETDFFGNASDSNSYSPRWRHVYASYGTQSCMITAGQTDSVFMDLDAVGSNLDINGIISGPLRQAQLRYTHQLSPSLRFIVAIERPNTDYVDAAASQLNNSSAPNTISNSTGTSGIPDMTASLTWSGSQGHLSLRGVARRLSVKSHQTSSHAAYSSNQTAWGLGISGKMNVFHKSGPFFQVNGGDGIGRYIPELEYYSAYLSNPLPTTLTIGRVTIFSNTNAPLRLDTQTAINGILGWEQFWTPEIRTNVMTSMTRVRVSPLAQQQTVSFNSELFKLIANIIYSPNEKIDCGLEILHVRRDTIRNVEGKNRYGVGTRLLGSVIYKF